MRKEVAAINNMSASNRSTLLDNMAKVTTSGGKAAFATNMEIANSIRGAFSQVDMSREGDVTKLFEEYREMMKPAYQEWGLSNTAYSQLLDNKIQSDISAFSTQISNMNVMIKNNLSEKITV